MSRIQNVVVSSVQDRTRLGTGTVAAGRHAGSLDPARHDRTAGFRLDGPAKVRGDARSLPRSPMDRLSYAALVHSPVTRGQKSRNWIQRRPSGARRDPGHDLPEYAADQHACAISMTNLSAVGNSDLPIMQDAAVRYNGQVIAAVLAETQEQADHAASLIKVAYAEQRANTRSRMQGRRADAPSILMDENRRTVGDAEQELQTRGSSRRQSYLTPGQNHNAIELHAVTVAWNGGPRWSHDTTQMSRAERQCDREGFRSARRSRSGFCRRSWAAASAARDCGITDCRRRSGQARRAPRASHAQSRQRLPHRRRPNPDRTARRDRRRRTASFTALIHTGLSVMPPHGACPEQYTSGSRGFIAREASRSSSTTSISTSCPTPSCARRERRSAPSPSNARSTNWRTRLGDRSHRTASAQRAGPSTRSAAPPSRSAP